jgi:hypothetical protein
MTAMRMMKQILSVLSCAVLVLFSPGAFAAAPKSAYKKVVKTWTHEDELYQRDDFYASMKWHVTYLSSEFQAGQNEFVAAVYDYSPAEKAKFVRERQNRFGGYTAFFVSFYGYDYKTADLAAKDSIWRLRLDAGGREVAPVKFEEIKKPTPFDAQLYPYINTWSRHYFVFFPRTSGLVPGEVKLKINGPNSRGELAW